MEKKYIILILLVIVGALVLIGSSFVINDKDHIKVENAKFKIPDGYSVIDVDNYYNLTNGKDSICIEKNVGNLDINSTLSNYKKIKQKENVSVEVSKFNVGSNTVYKVDSNNSGCHYWYDDNGKLYGFFTSKKSHDSDPLVVSLINSKSNSIF